MSTIRIKNGTILEPSTGARVQDDILIRDGQIVGIGANGQDKTHFEVDARDCLIVPGLIDSHAHLYPLIKNGTPGEALCFPSGVTTIVDAGSTGCATHALMSPFLDNSYLTIKCWLHICSTGLSSLPVLEDVDPSHVNRGAILEAVRRFSQRIVGIKVRTSQPIVKEFGWEPVKTAISIAEEAGLPVMVHCTNPPGPMEELLKMLRKGDVLTHVYQNTRYTILDDSRQHISKAAWEAKQRGVLFEAADARLHFSFEVSRIAMQEGFYPDFIGTDSTAVSVYQRPTAFSMAMQINKYLSLGMTEDMVLRACTSNTAKLLGLFPQIGSLKPGSAADVAVFRRESVPTVFRDRPGYDPSGEELQGKISLKPVLTIKNGVFVYRDLTF